jgi:hypothetical protein
VNYVHGFVLSSSLMVLCFHHLSWFCFKFNLPLRLEPLQDELLVLLESPPYWVLLVG